MLKPTLVSIVALDGRSERALLALAAAAAPGIAAPFGSAIADSARERDVEAAAVEHVQEQTGTGVVASIDGHTVVVGDAVLFSHLGLSLDAVGGWAQRLRQRGQHVLFVAVDGEAAGFLGVIDADV